jgi:hypothetical protein
MAVYIWLVCNHLRSGSEGSQSICKTMSVQVGDATGFPAGCTITCRSVCCCSMQNHSRCVIGLDTVGASAWQQNTLHTSVCSWPVATRVHSDAHVWHVAPLTGPAGQARARVLPMIVDATCAGVGCALSGYADLHGWIKTSFITNPPEVQRGRTVDQHPGAMRKAARWRQTPSLQGHDALLT